jgi:hypothetical protein
VDSFVSKHEIDMAVVIVLQSPSFKTPGLLQLCHTQTNRDTQQWPRLRSVEIQEVIEAVFTFCANRYFRFEDQQLKKTLLKKIQKTALGTLKRSDTAFQVLEVEDEQLRENCCKRIHQNYFGGT